jgi:hypothetical protein
MALRDRELRQLALSVQGDHSEAAVALACLVHLSHNRLRVNSGQHSAGIRHLHALGMTCVRLYASKIGVPWSDVHKAIVALRRAGDTARYLHTLPD